MTALAALKRITLDEESLVSCAKRPVPMPLEAVTPTMRAYDLLSTSLKLTRPECFFHRDFRRALNCCDGLTHNDFEVAERIKLSHSRTDAWQTQRSCDKPLALSAVRCHEGLKQVSNRRTLVL